MNVAGRRVVVSGGAGFVGEAIASRLLTEGASVVSMDRVEASSEARSAGLVGLEVDLADIGALRAGVAEAAEQMGGIDGLVCAHGYMDGEDGPEPDTTHPAWRKTFQVNVDATANVLAAGLPYLLESGRRSSIVVVGSLVATLGSASSELAYTASKGAVHALVRELAVVHAGVGLRANVVAPGPLAGGLFGSEGGLEEDVRLRRMPMGRRGTAEEVAGAVGFLLSDDASYITGVTLMVDGGASAAFLS